MRSAETNKLGTELELFTSVDYIGRGFPIMLPRGARLIKNLRNYIEYLEERYGYEELRGAGYSPYPRRIYWNRESRNRVDSAALAI